MKIVGILPMAGTGSRLGLPFHKSLAPVFDKGDVVPVYTYALKRLRIVTSGQVVAVVNEEAERGLLASLNNNGVTALTKNKIGELPSSLSYAAYQFPEETLFAVALPDALWWPEDAFEQLFFKLTAYTDGVMGLFRADARVLDEVDCVGSLITDIRLHLPEDAPERTVIGWGIMLVRRYVLLRLNDNAPLADQLKTYALDSVLFDGPYLDIGTKKRYHDYMVLR